MMKEEFEQRIGQAVSDSDYKVIEAVYTYHPVIDNVLGKDQIATIYKSGGMRIMRDMLPTAEQAKQLESEIAQLRGTIEEKERIYNALKNGDAVGGALKNDKTNHPQRKTGV